jgi:hypothetical protein
MYLLGPGWDVVLGRHLVNINEEIHSGVFFIVDFTFSPTFCHFFAALAAASPGSGASVEFSYQTEHGRIN